MHERIDRYRIESTLGEGGMGTVYAAFDVQLGRPVALKVIRRDVAVDGVARERFWREARLAASVNHPHICQLYEVGEADGVLFIARERLEILESVVERGFLSYETFVGHAWLDPLRSRPAFVATLNRAEARHLEAHGAFVAARGERLLGVTPA